MFANINVSMAVITTASQLLAVNSLFVSKTVSQRAQSAK
jgi:hypothetical protein